MRDSGCDSKGNRGRRDMVTHGVSINQKSRVFRDPPLSVRCNGLTTSIDVKARYRVGFVLRNVPRTSRCCTTLIVLQATITCKEDLT